jgi:hypothetical protein
LDAKIAGPANAAEAVQVRPPPLDGAGFNSAARWKPISETELRRLAADRSSFSLLL